MAVSRHTPIFVRATTAAAMLDMSTAEFRRLVAAGALPPPVGIGGHERWHVAQIEAMLSGIAARPNQDFEL